MLGVCIYAYLSTDAVSALPKVWVVISETVEAACVAYKHEACPPRVKKKERKKEEFRIVQEVWVSVDVKHQVYLLT